MHKRLWVAQLVVGLFFVIVGVLHFVVPDGLPARMAWMYDLSGPMHLFTGIVEVLGGLGLILPGLTKVASWLTPLAATGLGLLMAGAIVWHVGRGETPNVVVNLVLIIVLAYIAWGRWRLHLLPVRSATSE